MEATDGYVVKMPNVSKRKPSRVRSSMQQDSNIVNTKNNKKFSLMYTKSSNISPQDSQIFKIDKAETKEKRRKLEKQKESEQQQLVVNRKQKTLGLPCFSV